MTLLGIDDMRNPVDGWAERYAPFAPDEIVWAKNYDDVPRQLLTIASHTTSTHQHTTSNLQIPLDGSQSKASWMAGTDSIQTYTARRSSYLTFIQYVINL